jgi:hypothetical protein
MFLKSGKLCCSPLDVMMRPIFRMAQAIIEKMGRYNKNHCKRQKEQFILMPTLFSQQEQEACGK